MRLGGRDCKAAGEATPLTNALPACVWTLQALILKLPA
jgi:hypothetical protein